MTRSPAQPESDLGSGANSCVTWSKLLHLFKPELLICKMGIAVSEC